MLPDPIRALCELPTVSHKDTLRHLTHVASKKFKICRKVIDDEQLSRGDEQGV